jgi:hypothetical protein
MSTTEHGHQLLFLIPILGFGVVVSAR